MSTPGEIFRHPTPDRDEAPLVTVGEDGYFTLPGAWGQPGRVYEMAEQSDGSILLEPVEEARGLVLRALRDTFVDMFGGTDPTAADHFDLDLAAETLRIFAAHLRASGAERVEIVLRRSVTETVLVDQEGRDD
ncbi:hypothetical protein [Nocardioides sp. KR10-350]|uniref:hypothetical protein n=1 Tax=Nocardioides cheoyonin TaxID=3156615 RepID=UPI0032B3FD7C